MAGPSADLWWRDGADVLRLWAGLTGDEVVLEVSNVLNALGAFERVDEVERTEVFGELSLSLSVYVALTYIPVGDSADRVCDEERPEGFLGG